MIPVPPSRLFVNVLALLGLTLTATAQENSGVALVVGEDHLYLVEAPERWYLHPTGAASIGVGAAFCPEGQGWGDARAVMYVNSVPKNGQPIGLDQFVSGDVERARQQAPGLQVVKRPNIPTLQGSPATVRHFITTDSVGCEAVAYIDAPTVIVLVVLNSRTPASFRGSLDSFARLVDSYEWVTSDRQQIEAVRKAR